MRYKTHWSFNLFSRIGFSFATQYIYIQFEAYFWLIVSHRILFIQRYHLRYKTHISFILFLRIGFSFIATQYIPNLKPIFDCYLFSRIGLAMRYKTHWSFNLFSRIGFSFATQYIANLKQLLDSLLLSKKNRQMNFGWLVNP